MAEQAIQYFDISNTEISENGLNSTLVSKLKTSLGVFALFGSQPFFSLLPEDLVLNQLAVALVCNAVKDISTKDFCKAVESSKVTKFLSDVFQTSETHLLEAGNKIYNKMFEDVRKKKGFDFSGWEKEKLQSFYKSLSDLFSKNFFNVEAAKIANDDNWMPDVVFKLYKVKKVEEILNDKGIQHDKDRSTEALKDSLNAWIKNIPHSQSISDNNGYIPSWIKPGTLKRSEYNFLEDIKAVANTITKSHVRITHGYYDYNIYGKALAEFLESEMVKGMGFRSDVALTNDESRGSCFIANTSILLDNKKVVPIQEVKFKDRVLGQNGNFSIRSDCDVITTFKSDILIYGFNQEEPFFTAGHPFWTTDGFWKAIDSKIAREENPDLEVYDLKIGDSVCKLVNELSLEYSEILIQNFSTKVLPAGQKVYGLHLIEGPASYHANGYLVKMNYPVITEKRLYDGFTILTQAEREQVWSHLEPIMPLLSKSIGSFVEGAFLRSLILRDARGNMA